MLHAYDQRFDVMGNLENFCELNKALTKPPEHRTRPKLAAFHVALHVPNALATHIVVRWCTRSTCSHVSTSTFAVSNLRVILGLIRSLWPRVNLKSQDLNKTQHIMSNTLYDKNNKQYICF